MSALPKAKADAVEVLYHLNALGYKNITADTLKTFTKDLKKFIKYEKYIFNDEHISMGSNNILIKLHNQTITSPRAKVDKKKNMSRETVTVKTDNFGIKKNSRYKDLNSDPVALYSFYSALWKKFSNRFPT